LFIHTDTDFVECIKWLASADIAPYVALESFDQSGRGVPKSNVLYGWQSAASRHLFVRLRLCRRGEQR